jgi:hypothetical protein
MAENTSNAHSLRIGKLQTGHRQLNAAIRLYLEGDDPIAVVTLAGAACQTFSELTEQQGPKSSWDRHAQQVMGLSTQTCFDALRKARRFMKLADGDGQDVLEWSCQETEALILAAIMNAEELGGLSLPECIYRLWYFAKYVKRELALPLGAAELFPAMAKLSDIEQRARGAEVLRRESARLELAPLSGDRHARTEGARP